MKVEMMGTLCQPLPRGEGWRQKTRKHHLNFSNVAQNVELQATQAFFSSIFRLNYPLRGTVAFASWRLKSCRFFCQINANLSFVTYKFAKCQTQRMESKLAAMLTTSAVITTAFLLKESTITDVPV